MVETYLPDAEIALQLPKRVYPIFSCYNGKTLNFSQFFHCKNGFSNHVFTSSSANPDIRRIHCQIRKKKYSSKNKESSLTDLKINPILLEN